MATAFGMPERTNLRHAAFGYRSSAAYFVTICAHERRCLFGTVRCGRTVLNERGKIVVREWRRSEEMRDEVVLDAFVVMPNHFHGIVCLVPPDVDDVSPRGYDLDVGSNSPPVRNPLDDNVGTTSGSSLHQRGEEASREEEEPNGPSAKSLSAMVGGFKAAVTKRVNERRGTPGAPVWHADSGRHTIYGSRGNLGADNRRHGAPAANTLSAIRNNGRTIGHVRKNENDGAPILNWRGPPGATGET